MDKIYSLYIVCCSDNTYYTGLTTDLDRRIAKHNSAGPKANTGSKYTRSRQPVKLVFSLSGIKRKRAAYVGEYYIKKLSRERKEMLIKGDKKVLGLLKKALKEAVNE